MLVKQFAKKDLKFLLSNATVQQAIDLMNEWEVDMAPVIKEDEGTLMGQVFLSALEAHKNKDAGLLSLEMETDISIEENKHIFEAIRLMLKYEVRSLPVIDNEQSYKGHIRKKQVLEALSNLLNLSELGSILTIEMEQYDFTLSKLVELIETEGAKILGLAVETPTGQDNRFRVSIKLNTQKTGNITAALRRFGYHVTTNTENDHTEIDYKARASELLHYIDM